VVTVFAEVDSLPDAEQQLAILNRHAERRSEQCRFDVRWHVVHSLGGVPIGKRLGSDPAERHLQIPRHIGVGVLVDDQRRRGVLKKGMEKSHTQFPQRFRHAAHQVVGDEMKAATTRRQPNQCLMPVSRHGCSLPDVAFPSRKMSSGENFFNFFRVGSSPTAAAFRTDDPTGVSHRNSASDGFHRRPTADEQRGSWESMALADATVSWTKSEPPEQGKHASNR